jgi:hypothetical protein
VENGAHSPCPVQAPATKVQLFEQVSIRWPQFPQATVLRSPASGLHSPLGAEQLPWVKVQDDEQTSVLVAQCPHCALMSLFAPGRHSPSPMQPPATKVQLLEHRDTCVPQLPQTSALVSPGAQTPSPVQPAGVKVHAAEQVSRRLPHLPHDSFETRESPGLQAPWPEQVPVVHAQAAEQMSVRWPHIGQGASLVSPGVQARSLVHVPVIHMQVGAQVSFRWPHRPQAIIRVCPGVHSTPARHELTQVAALGIHSSMQSFWFAGHVPPHLVPSHVAVPPLISGQGAQEAGLQLAGRRSSAQAPLHR